jgi:hypothetical protein
MNKASNMGLPHDANRTFVTKINTQDTHIIKKTTIHRLAKTANILREQRHPVGPDAIKGTKPEYEVSVTGTFRKTVVMSLHIMVKNGTKTICNGF